MTSGIHVFPSHVHPLLQTVSSYFIAFFGFPSEKEIDRKRSGERFFKLVSKPHANQTVFKLVLFKWCIVCPSSHTPSQTKKTEWKKMREREKKKSACSLEGIHMSMWKKESMSAGWLHVTKMFFLRSKSLLSSFTFFSAPPLWRRKGVWQSHYANRVRA